MSLEQRKEIIDMVTEARDNGARLQPACRIVSIDAGTWRRWQAQGDVVADKRSDAQRPDPAHKLSEQERQAILEICHSERFRDMPPSQIVPILADEGIFLGSESTLYRLLHENDQQQHRGRAKAPVKRAKPTEFKASSPNQCWCWDVTWLKTRVRGQHYYF